MTDHRQRSAEQLFKDKAASLMKVRSTVSVECCSPEDALIVFNWLEQQIGSPQSKPPFEDRCRVRATRDTTEVWFCEGDPPELDGDVCMEGNAYRVRTCFWHAEHGWLVQIGESRFEAAAFELAKPAVPGDPPPFQNGVAVKCVQSSPDYTADGWLCDTARCMAGYKYVVDTCMIRPDGGWFVVLGGALHLAEHFELWDDCEETR
jgi:hypothetical protein